MFIASFPGGRFTDEVVTTTSVAIDGTAVVTPAQQIDGDDEVVHDGDSAGSQPVDEQGRAPAGEERPAAKVLGYGIHDRRKVYTADPDARGGYRTATERRKGHLRRLRAPPVHHGPRRDLEQRRRQGRPVRTRAEVEDGVSPDRSSAPLHAAGIHVTWQTTSHHEGSRPFNDNAFIYNGRLVSKTLPAELRDLPLPPLGADEAARRTRHLPRHRPHRRTHPADPNPGWINSALGGDFVDLDTRFSRGFDLTRINVLLGFTIPGYNRRRLRAFADADQQPDPTGDERIATERRTVTSSDPAAAQSETTSPEGTDPPG